MGRAIDIDANQTLIPSDTVVDVYHQITGFKGAHLSQKVFSLFAATRPDGALPKYIFSSQDQQLSA